VWVRCGGWVTKMGGMGVAKWGGGGWVPKLGEGIA